MSLTGTTLLNREELGLSIKYCQFKKAEGLRDHIDSKPYFMFPFKHDLVIDCRKQKFKGPGIFFDDHLGLKRCIQETTGRIIVNPFGQVSSHLDHCDPKE